MTTDIRWPDWGGQPPKDTPIASWSGHQGYSIDVHRHAGKEYKVIQCEPCILNHVIPLPDESALERYYQTLFYQTEKPDYIDRYEEDRVWWEMTHRHTLESIDFLEPWLDGVSRKWVLDIGAGPGIFLDVAKQRYPQNCTFAIEPSPMLGERLRERGHAVFTGTLARYMDDELTSRFHLIHAYEVLEHVPIPEDFLLRCRNLLYDNGIIAITVPNDYSALQYAACEQLGLEHYWVSPPQHLSYFTPKMLQLLLRRCGFKLLDIRGTFPMEQFLLSGRNYIGNDTVGRQCHRERMAWELSMDKAGLWYILEEQYRMGIGGGYTPSIGREIVAIARKT